jgi:hypothetical protein
MIEASLKKGKQAVNGLLILTLGLHVFRIL